MDILLANLKPEEIRFIREELLVAKEIKTFIKDKEFAEAAQQLILADVNNLIVTSRARDALILNALVKAITGDVQEMQRNRTIMEKIGDSLGVNKQEAKE